MLKFGADVFIYDIIDAFAVLYSSSRELFPTMRLPWLRIEVKLA